MTTVPNSRAVGEACAYTRRRLVTAFVSGAPEGQEPEPARPARAVVGGLVLAVLLLAGCAAARVLSPEPGADPAGQRARATSTAEDANGVVRARTTPLQWRRIGDSNP